MPFSVAYGLLCICVLYLAGQKQKQTEQKRRCNQKFGNRDTSSRIAHK